MARRRSLLGKGARKITGIPSATRSARPTPPADHGSTGAAYGEPAADPAADDPPPVKAAADAAATLDADPLDGELIADEMPAVDDLGADDDTELIDHAGMDVDAADLPDEGELPAAGALPAVDELVEDDEPLIGSDIPVPPPETDEDDGAATPDDVVAHMQVGGAGETDLDADDGFDEDTVDGGDPVDDDLVLFDDEHPTEQVVIDPSITDEDPASAMVDVHTYAPEDMDEVSQSDEGDAADSLPGFEDDEGGDDAPAVAAVSATPAAAAVAGVAVAGVAVAGVAVARPAGQDDAVDEGGELPDMSLPDLPDDDAPRGAPMYADDGSGEAFFGDEEEDPPTEDSVGPLPQDFSSLYRAPMDVPEPPPIPGILDRYTPAPVRNQGARSGSGYVPVPPKNVAAPIITPPVGLWDDPPSAGGSRGSAKDTPPPPSYKAAPAVEDETTFYQDTWFLAAVAFAALVALAVLIGLFWVSSQNQGDVDEPTVPSSVETPVAPPSDRPGAELVPTPGGEGDGVDVTVEGTDTPVVTPSNPGSDRPSPERGLRPDATTPTAPPVTPAVTTPTTPAARTGRLKIRASKQVLVYVNGQPVGLTPLDLDRPAGQYTIAARVNGQQRTERVELSSGTIRLVDF